MNNRMVNEGVTVMVFGLKNKHFCCEVLASVSHLYATNFKFFEQLQLNECSAGPPGYQVLI